MQEIVGEALVNLLHIQENFTVEEKWNCQNDHVYTGSSQEAAAKYPKVERSPPGDGVVEDVIRWCNIIAIMKME